MLTTTEQLCIMSAPDSFDSSKSQHWPEFLEFLKWKEQRNNSSTVQVMDVTVEPSTSSLFDEDGVQIGTLQDINMPMHSTPTKKYTTPTKPRRWCGENTSTIEPRCYRPDHMLYGTNKYKSSRLGLEENTAIPGYIRDARNHFTVSIINDIST